MSVRGYAEWKPGAEASHWVNATLILLVRWAVGK